MLLAIKRTVLAIILIILFWFPTPALAEMTTDTPTKPATEAVKSYFLIALPNGSRRSVKLDPPAMRLGITSESGNFAIRCGYKTNIYSCSPGKRIEIKAESEQPIREIWAENSHEDQVRLKINVYENSQEPVGDHLDLEASLSAQRVVSGRRYLGVQRRT